MTNLFSKHFFYYGLLTALFLESVSFIAFFLPEYRTMLFIILVLVFLALCAKDVRSGIYIVFIELAIGGHGYLISIPYGTHIIAIRHVWFMCILTVFTARHYRFIIDTIKNTTIARRFIFFAIIILFSLSVGYLNGYPVINIISDGNAYLFYLLLFPLLFVRERFSKEHLLSLLFGALVILSIKTVLTLAIFSNGMLLASSWYEWVRDLRFGEITYIDFAFYRVFFQSQVMLLPAIALISSYILHRRNEMSRVERSILLGLLTIFISSFILSFSRSFLVGAFAGVIVFCCSLILFRKELYKNVSTLILFLLIATVGGLVILAGAQSFTLDPTLFTRRLQFLDEPAAASRWALLPEMTKSIEVSPVYGSGFGKTITYISQDPRILSIDGSGEYTTFSFEWGYLDIWLKMGLIGLGAQLYLLAFFLSLQLKNMRKNNTNWYAFGMSASLIMLISLHFFTPYINHPIGIGYLMLGLL